VVIVYFGQILKIRGEAQILGDFFHGISYVLILKKMGWATVWAILSQTHLVTLTQTNAPFFRVLLVVANLGCLQMLGPALGFAFWEPANTKWDTRFCHRREKVAQFTYQDLNCKVLSNGFQEWILSKREEYKKYVCF
jgi:hypothetical protein